MKPDLRSTGAFLLPALVLALLSSVPVHAAAPTATAADIDRFLSQTYPAAGPGAAVLVSKDGQALIHKGYGIANLELGVPITPDSVFEVGSVTKQFTAAAVLMLQERGLLSIEDDITKHLPDFPTQGKKVTIENLLTHTSGIPSYTELPEWLPRMREDMTPDQLIGLFMGKPFQFDPGTKWEYDNSGYALLGAIIEKASGKSYERFVEDEIFKPLGMAHSLYGSWSDLVPHRAAGYEKDGDHYVNTPYISMTQPYAAGSLMSTVDDLALWDKALSAGTLLKKESLARMFTPYKLPSGFSTRYGFGWGVSEIGGKRVIEHGGGINGFTCDELRVPEVGLFIAVLTNSTSGALRPEAVAQRIAGMVLGVAERKAVQLDPKTLGDYMGVYRSADATRAIIREGDKLFAQRTGGGSKQEIAATARDQFFYPSSAATLRFLRDAQGKVTAAQVDQGYGPEEPPMARTDDPLPAEKKAAAVDPALFSAYAGTYELAPSFRIVITREGDQIFAQATGQPRLELFPESETKLFLKEVDAQIEFQKDGSGKVTGMVLHQGGRDMPGKRVQ